MYSVAVHDKDLVPICNIHQETGVEQFFKTYSEIKNDRYQMYFPAALFDEELIECDRLSNFKKYVDKTIEGLRNPEKDDNEYLFDFIEEVAGELEYASFKDKKNELAKYLATKKFNNNDITLLDSNLTMEEVSYILYDDGKEIYRSSGHKLVTGNFYFESDELSDFLEVR